MNEPLTLYPWNNTYDSPTEFHWVERETLPDKKTDCRLPFSQSFRTADTNPGTRGLLWTGCTFTFKFVCGTQTPVKLKPPATKGVTEVTDAVRTAPWSNGISILLKGNIGKPTGNPLTLFCHHHDGYSQSSTRPSENPGCWTCLWGYVLIRLLERRPVHCG